jgi:GTP-binding protein LepA
MEKLVLNDSSLFVETDVSPALWHGYRCGFLWLLHLEIVKERLLREFGMDVIMTAPQVTYRVVLLWDKRSEYSRFLPEYIESEKWQKCTRILISNPEELPNREKYLYIEEPIAKVEIITPLEYVWNLMQLSQDRRWSFKNQQFIDSDRVMLTYELPMNELIWDFYDEIKSLSSGYASLNYEFIKYSEDDLVKLEILIADEKVDALAFICHRKQSRYLWWKICANLKESIPKALFTIKIQAVVWGDVVWREDISAMRKDVTAKLYGWDITRKKKLLEKQKRGKKRMRQIGNVEMPQEAFLSVLKLDDE